MAFSTGQKIKIPRFSSTDKSLEEALNLLGKAIESIHVPDVKLLGGTMEWSGNAVLMRPDPVRPGTGSAAPVIPPLTIVSSRPAYIPEPTTPVAEGYARYYVTWGFADNKLPTNWNDYFDVDLSGDTRYFELKVYLNPSGYNITSSCEIVEDTTSGDNPDWEENGDRPSHLFVPLGMVFIDSGAAIIYNNGGGSISLGEHLAGLSQSQEVGFTYQKRLYYMRNGY